MEKEGKVDLLTVLILSILIFVIFAVLVMGKNLFPHGDYGVIQEFPVNNTNASAIYGYADTSLANMSNFTGSNVVLRCNISMNYTAGVITINITNVTFFYNQSPIDDLGIHRNNDNGTVFYVNDTFENQTINLSLGNIPEGRYYWACKAENNGSYPHNLTQNRSFILDKTVPGFTTSVFNTTSYSVSTEDTVYIGVNATDAWTTIDTVTLFVNVSGTSNNVVNRTNSSFSAGSVHTNNNTLVNLSFVIPGISLGDVLNFTLHVNDSVNNVNLTQAIILSVDNDASPPGINLSNPIDSFNQSSTIVEFNFTAFDNNASTAFDCSINVSLNGLPFGNISSIKPLDSTAQLNSTNSNSIKLTNGTYNWNVTCLDGAGNSNISISSSFTIDQIPPKFDFYNFTDQQLNATDGTSAPGNGTELGVGTGISTAQGRTIFAIANWTDNVTQPFQGALQFYNTSSVSWETLNNSHANYSAYENATWTNFSFPIPTDHNQFEGRNVSFRIIGNDTVGNQNSSDSVKNFTIEINDTKTPTLLVSSVGGQIHTNGTNTTDNTPTVVWNVTEGNSLRYIAVQIDGSTDVGCNLFTNFTGSVESNRNGSITVSSSGTCPLDNGTTVVRLTAEDIWGNSNLYIHSFEIETGAPSITLSTFENKTNTDFPTGITAENKSNVTQYMGINFTAVNGGAGQIKNFTWKSSCNSSEQFGAGSNSQWLSANLSFIYPFFNNISDSCTNIEANQTVDLTVIDTAGSSITNRFQFALDDLVTSISTHTLTNHKRYSNFVELNVSALDQMSRIDTIGYYLDGDDTVLDHTNNGTLTIAQGSNTSILNQTVNFTAGKHTIKITVNDTMGNRKNSSVFTFTQTGPIPPPDAMNHSMSAYISNVTGYPANVTIRLKDSAGVYQDLGATNTTDSDQTYEIFLYLNSTSTTNQTNVTITEINGSGANWDKINFSVFINETNFVAGVENNFTTDVFDFVMFNASFDEFLNNQSDYYATILLSYNISGPIVTAGEVWYFPNSSDLTQRTNVSKCSSAFTTATTDPCWNYSANGRTLVSVPHFNAAVGIGNDSRPPTVNVTLPRIVQTESSFFANITVSNDAVLCNVSYSGQASSLTPNRTMEGPTIQGDAKICLYHLNVSNGTLENNNITFSVFDANGNLNTTVVNFNVSDLTPPNFTGVANTTTGSVDWTLTVTANESVNVTIHYGTAAALTSTTNVSQIDFEETQAVLLGASSASSSGSTAALSAGTRYYFNVTTCDKAGNCIENGTFTFLTDEAAAAAAAAAAASSGGGGGGGAVAVSNIQAQKSQLWSNIPSGSSVSMKIDNTEIGVTQVSVSVTADVNNVELKVGSFKNNPVATEAAPTVYQYLQITKKNLDDDATGKITISFRVPKSWLNENNLQSTDILLFRYKDNEWSELTTTVTSSDSEYVNYEAETPGLSFFAIATKVVAEETIEEGEEVPGEETPEEAPTPVEKPKPFESPTKAPAGWIILVIVIIVGIVGFVVYQQKKKGASN